MKPWYDRLKECSVSVLEEALRDEKNAIAMHKRNAERIGRVIDEKRNEHEPKE